MNSRAEENTFPRATRQAAAVREPFLNLAEIKSPRTPIRVLTDQDYHSNNWYLKSKMQNEKREIRCQTSPKYTILVCRVFFYQNSNKPYF